MPPNTATAQTSQRGGHTIAKPAVINFILAVIVGPLLTSNSVSAQQAEVSLAALRQAERALTDLIEQAEPALVAVHRSRNASARIPPNVLQLQPDPFNRLRRPLASPPLPPSGAGVVIDPRGLVLTQYLTINPRPDAGHEITTIDGKRYPAKVKGADPRSGLAVLEVTGVEFPALSLGRAEELRKGSFVVALGNPFAIVADGQPSASRGTVVNLGQKAAEGVNLNNTLAQPPGVSSTRTTLHHFGTLIQTDARLGWSAGGGALIDLNGDLVGVTTTASTTAGHEQPAGYAIPLNKTFRRIVETLSRGEEVEYGMLGISLGQASNEPPGIVIQRAFVGSPANRAGLRANDVILKIADKPVANVDDLLLAVSSLPPNTPMPVTFSRRGAAPQVTNVRLAKFYVPGTKVITSAQRKWRGLRVDFVTAIPPEQLEESSESGRIDPAGCVAVVEVDADSVSWKSGVRPGMFISHVGEQRVTTPGEFWTAVEKADASVNLRFTSEAPRGATQPAIRQPAFRRP